MSSHNFRLSCFSTLKKFVCLLFVLNITVSGYAQKSVRIGYIDTEYILENITEYQNSVSQLDAKIQEWKSEIESRLTTLEDQKKQLNNERILLTSELIKDREEDLQIIENEIIEYQQNRFGPNGDLLIQKKQLMQPIQDQIFAAVQEIARTKKYDFIFDKSADVVMLYSADRYDISEQILRTINRASKRTQAETKKQRKEAEEEEAIVEVDSGKDERQQLLDKRKEERAALLEKKREDQLKSREERKKQVAAKKQKVLDDRAKARAEKNNKGTTAEENQLTPESSKSKILEAREARKKELEAKRQKVIDEREKARAEKTEEKTIATEAPKVLSERELRKKALEEKKKRAFEERKERLEAQKRKRDSIRNNN